MMLTRQLALPLRGSDFIHARESTAAKIALASSSSASLMLSPACSSRAAASRCRASSEKLSVVCRRGRVARIGAARGVEAEEPLDPLEKLSPGVAMPSHVVRNSCRPG